MEKEIEDYITNKSNMLNGQLRGAINLKAREENAQLIMITMGNLFESGYTLGKAIQADSQNLDQLKKELGIYKGDQLKMDFNGGGKDST